MLAVKVLTDRQTARRGDGTGERFTRLVVVRSTEHQVGNKSPLFFWRTCQSSRGGVAGGCPVPSVTKPSSMHILFFTAVINVWAGMGSMRSDNSLTLPCSGVSAIPSDWQDGVSTSRRRCSAHHLPDHAGCFPVTNTVETNPRWRTTPVH